LEPNSQSEQILQMKTLLKERNIDTKKLREGVAELTRQKIVDAAMRLFASDGYQNTSIDKIAQDAGVTKGAVYHHFKDKKELLMVANRSRQLRTHELLRKTIAKEGDFFEGMRKALRGEFRLLRNDSTMRGVTREYLAMAMIDTDVNQMYRHEDAELLDIFSSELARRSPNLSSKRRALIAQEIYLSLAGLFLASVMDTPIGALPEKLIDSVMERLRCTVEG
jgi:TetR/AcrR family transcriptional repressor of nem operon